MRASHIPGEEQEETTRSDNKDKSRATSPLTDSMGESLLTMQIYVDSYCRQAYSFGAALRSHYADDRSLA